MRWRILVYRLRRDRRSRPRVAVWRELRRVGAISRRSANRANAGLAEQVATGRFSRARLAAEERNVDRLRRWYRELGAKDLFGAPLAPAAEAKLKQAVAPLDDLAEQVHRARPLP